MLFRSDTTLPAELQRPGHHPAHQFAEVHILPFSFSAFPYRSLFPYLYANAAVTIAMEYTSAALQPRDKSLIGAFNPSITGP